MPDAVGDAVGVADALADALGDALGDADGDAELDAVGLGVASLGEMELVEPPLHAANEMAAVAANAK